MTLTMKDIAKMAGVSTTTISRVINNTKPVKKEIKEKVFRIIEETGYRPNGLARGLIYKSTNLVGVIIPQVNTHFGQILDGIEAVAQKKGYNILLSNSQSDVDKEIQSLNIFNEKRMDGIILSGVELTDKHYETIKLLNIPIVIVGQKPTKMELPWVDVDNYKAVHEMIRFLIRYGHRKIAMIHGPLHDLSAGYSRLQAYKDVLEESGIPVNPDFMMESDFSLNGGYQAMARILGMKELPTVIFAASDLIAIGAMGCAADLGFHIPKDLSICGFDDIDTASAIRPKLSTIHASSQDMGARAMEMLTKRMEGSDWKKLDPYVSYRLKIRESTLKLKD